MENHKQESKLLKRVLKRVIIIKYKAVCLLLERSRNVKTADKTKS